MESTAVSSCSSSLSANEQKLLCISEIGIRMNHALLNFYAAVASIETKLSQKQAKHSFLAQYQSNGFLALFVHMLATPVIGTNPAVPVVLLATGMLQTLLQQPERKEANGTSNHNNSNNNNNTGVNRNNSSHEYQTQNHPALAGGDKDHLERVRQNVAMALQNLRENLPFMSLEDLYWLQETFDARRVTKTIFEERLENALDRLESLFLRVFDQYEVKFGTIVTPTGRRHVAVRRKYIHTWTDRWIQRIFHYTTPFYRMVMKCVVGKDRASGQRIRKLRTMEIVTAIVVDDFELQMLMQASRYWTDEVLDASKGNDDNTHEEDVYAVWHRSSCVEPNYGLTVSWVDLYLMSNLK